jgi:hypothetical protein
VPLLRPGSLKRANLLWRTGQSTQIWRSLRDRRNVRGCVDTSQLTTEKMESQKVWCGGRTQVLPCVPCPLSFLLLIQVRAQSGFMLPPCSHVILLMAHLTQDSQS